MTKRSVLVENVSKIYPAPVSGGDPVHALQDVSLSVTDGERLGIVGVNGAGKSTLLQIIAGVMEPTSGRVHVHGQVHAVLTVGMGIREEATGRENLFLDGAVQGRSRAEIAPKLDEMIAFADLGDFIDRPVRTYSTGMKARLAFASLISINPEILIIDEALAVGDAFFAAKAQAAMKRLTDEGAIVILVTHASAVIAQTCQRCIWIDGGRVKMDGGAIETTDAYSSAIVDREAVNVARKFGDSGRAWAKSDDCRVAQVELRGRPTGENLESLESGQPAVLSARLEGAAAVSVQKVRIWAERNDGLILFDEMLEVDQDRLRNAAGGEMLINMGKLEWRPALYQLHVEAHTADGAQAHAATSIKIWSNRTIFGGAPLLRRPIDIRSHQV